MPASYGRNRGRKAVYFSLVSPLDQNPDPKYKPYIHLKCDHDFMFVIDLESAQNAIDFYQTAIGSVLCYDTVPAEFLTKIININSNTERFVRAQTKEREASPTKKS